MIDQGVIEDFFKTYLEGRYQVGKAVGEGGMGSVFICYDTALQRDCVIKVLNPDQMDRGDTITRFKQEAIIMARLSHPAIAQAYDVGVIDNLLPFIVLEWVEGGSLWDYVKLTGPMPARMATFLMSLICAGIEAAHAKEVIHRDIKPDNILLKEDGRPKVIDFGISVMHSDDKSRLTQARTGMGSTGFMAIEQMHDAVLVDVRADVHGLGVTLWSILKKQMPPRGFVFGHQLAVVPELLEGIDKLLVPIIVKATEVAREQRYATVTELREALETVLASGDLPEDVVTVSDHTTKDKQSLLPIPTKIARPEHVSAVSRSEIPRTPKSIDTSISLPDSPLSSDTQFAIELQKARQSRLWKYAISVLVIVAAVILGVYLGIKEKISVVPELSSVVEVRSEPDVVTYPESIIEPPVIPEPITRAPKVLRDTQLDVHRLVERRGIETEVVRTGSGKKVVPVVVKHTTTKVKIPKGERKIVKSIPKETHDVVKPEVVKPEIVKEVKVTKEIIPKSVAVTEKVRVKLNFPDGEAVKVWLIGPAGRHNLPSSVPPGTYKVIGAFPSGERTAISTLIVKAGESIRLDCNSSFSKCKVH